MDASRKRRILRQHLQTDQWLGAMAVPVGGAATTEPVPAPRAALSPGKPVTSLHPSPEIPRSGASPPLTMPLRTREEKQQLLTAMDDHEVKDCRRCGLCEHRTHTVFGEGDPNARLMFIGEGPGEHEDLQGRPFVGRAGELLDKMIVAMGLTRAGVYIANVVKCRPPNNRTPSPVEISVCWDYLLRQIRIIHPQIIVTLGPGHADAVANHQWHRHVARAMALVSRVDPAGTGNSGDAHLPPGLSAAGVYPGKPPQSVGRPAESHDGAQG